MSPPVLLSLDTRRFHDLIQRGLLLLACSLWGCAGVTGSDPGARTPGTVLDDQVVESLAKKEMRKADVRLEDAHLVVVSHNGVVLLAGQVQSAELRDIAQRAVETLAPVRRVHNELAVSDPTSLGQRSTDAWLTSKIKTRLATHAGVDANRINVTTQDRVVYLMGTVPRQQADYAVEVSQQVRGVEKIVKVFEYTD